MASPMPRTRAVPKGGTFQIIAGSHLGDGPKGCQCDPCLNSGGQNHVYEAYDPRRHGTREEYDNDIIDSPKVDLELIHNKGPASIKFRRVQDQTPAPVPTLPLAKMSLAQLLAVAEDEGIDLKGTGKRDEVIKLIEKARSAPVAAQV